MVKLDEFSAVDEAWTAEFVVGVDGNSLFKVVFEGDTEKTERDGHMAVRGEEENRCVCSFTELQAPSGEITAYSFTVGESIISHLPSLLEGSGDGILTCKLADRRRDRKKGSEPFHRHGENRTSLSRNREG